MRRVRIGDPHRSVHRLSDQLGLDGAAVNHYVLSAGEEFPGGLHAHVDQEEVFLVVNGTATFETLDGPVHVSSSEAIRFERGEYHSGRNADDEPLVAVALGIPRDSDDVRVPATCPDCGADALRLDTDGDGVAFECPDCAATYVPAPCPVCDGDDLRFTTDRDHDPVVECGDCLSRFDDPPLAT